MIKPSFFSKNNLSMHSNHIHPIEEADILTVLKLCAKTFVYSGNDDVFSTVTPSTLLQTSFEKQLDPRGPIAFRGGSVPEFLRKPKATAPPVLPCGSAHEKFVVKHSYFIRRYNNM